MLKDWESRILALSLKGTIRGILHTVNDNIADTVQDEGTQVLYGKNYFYEELLGLKFKISPFSFFQTNSLGAEMLYEKARKYIGDTKDKVVLTCTVEPERSPRFWRRLQNRLLASRL